MHQKITANIVADSINENGCRITTFIVQFPRIVLAEFNTHRMLSKNSASSRARPFSLMLKEANENAFVPVRWMKKHSGMQGKSYMNEEESRKAEQAWLAARDAAVSAAKLLDELNVSKQIVNRTLEPYLMHQVIVTGTDFENFFALRAHEDAEIHIGELAQKMLSLYNDSKPKFLKAGEWHIPFGDQFDSEKLTKTTKDTTNDIETAKLKIACARCARLSYKNFGSEEIYDYSADIRLFHALVDSNHMSPLEHVACSMSPEEWQKSANGYCGNFRGYVQYRKMFPNENRSDQRVKK